MINPFRLITVPYKFTKGYFKRFPILGPLSYLGAASMMTGAPGMIKEGVTSLFGGGGREGKTSPENVNDPRVSTSLSGHFDTSKYDAEKVKKDIENKLGRIYDEADRNLRLSISKEERKDDYLIDTVAQLSNNDKEIEKSLSDVLNRTPSNKVRGGKQYSKFDLESAKNPSVVILDTLKKRDNLLLNSYSSLSVGHNVDHGSGGGGDQIIVPQGLEEGNSKTNGLLDSLLTLTISGLTILGGLAGGAMAFKAANLGIDSVMGRANKLGSTLNFNSIKATMKKIELENKVQKAKQVWEQAVVNKMPESEVIKYRGNYDKLSKELDNYIKGKGLGAQFNRIFGMGLSDDYKNARRLFIASGGDIRQLDAAAKALVDAGYNVSSRKSRNLLKKELNLAGRGSPKLGYTNDLAGLNKMLDEGTKLNEEFKGVIKEFNASKDELIKYNQILKGSQLTEEEITNLTKGLKEDLIKKIDDNNKIPEKYRANLVKILKGGEVEINNLKSIENGLKTSKLAQAAGVGKSMLGAFGKLLGAASVGFSAANYYDYMKDGRYLSASLASASAALSFSKIGLPIALAIDGALAYIDSKNQDIKNASNDLRALGFQIDKGLISDEVYFSQKAKANIDNATTKSLVELKDNKSIWNTLTEETQSYINTLIEKRIKSGVDGTVDIIDLMRIESRRTFFENTKNNLEDEALLKLADKVFVNNLFKYRENKDNIEVGSGIWIGDSGITKKLGISVINKGSKEFGHVSIRLPVESENDYKKYKGLVLFIIKLLVRSRTSDLISKYELEVPKLTTGSGSIGEDTLSSKKVKLGELRNIVISFYDVHRNNVGLTISYSKLKESNLSNVELNKLNALGYITKSDKNNSIFSDDLKLLGNYEGNIKSRSYTRSYYHVNGVTICTPDKFELKNFNGAFELNPDEKIIIPDIIFGESTETTYGDTELTLKGNDGQEITTTIRDVSEQINSELDELNGVTNNNKSESKSSDVVSIASGTSEDNGNAHKLINGSLVDSNKVNISGDGKESSNTDVITTSDGKVIFDPNKIVEGTVEKESVKSSNTIPSSISSVYSGVSNENNYLSRDELMGGLLALEAANRQSLLDCTSLIVNSNKILTEYTLISLGNNAPFVPKSLNVSPSFNNYTI